MFALEFLIADNARVIEEVEKSIRNLKFKAAMNKGNQVPSYTIVNYKFVLEES